MLAGKFNGQASTISGVPRRTVSVRGEDIAEYGEVPLTYLCGATRALLSVDPRSRAGYLGTLGMDQALR